ncbi:MAG: DNA/RNA non-specific endonuclease [Phycisphaerales bacterium]|nr:DNA/RNA non-specific endonuclease [Phycisphaerales bacterium]
MLSKTLLDLNDKSRRAAMADKELAKVLSAPAWEARVNAEKRHAPTSPDSKRAMAMRRSQSADPDQSVRILERIIRGNDLVPTNYLDRGSICARAVCRIRLMNSTRETVGFGTGFLVARNTLLTNHHVLPTAAHARWARAEFSYEHDALGGDRVPVIFDFDLSIPPVINAPLDFCLVGVQPYSIGDGAPLLPFGWLPLDPTPGKTVEGEYLTIIQHPGGERKQICVRENRLIKYLDHSLWYQTDTVAGSSGAPVFNNGWQVVGLHHSGVPRTNKKGDILTVDGKIYDASMNENTIAWLGNEGIRVSSILAHLRTRSDNTLADRVLRSEPAPTPAASATHPTSAAAATVSIPVYVAPPRDAGSPIGRHVASPSDAPAGTEPPVESMRLEKKTNPRGAIAEYPKRSPADLVNAPGYQPDFLGKKSTLRVPFPKVVGTKPWHKPFRWGPGGRNDLLHYSRHSVLLSEQRKLALYAVVNVDDTQRYSQQGNDPDWLPDPRVEGHEVSDKFYKTSPGVRADGQGNRRSPFDRGHMVQQEDATWGDSDLSAARASVETFYFPNAAPQVARFNQRGNAWLGLEDYVIEVFAAETGKACVLSGPVFDAPSGKGPLSKGTLALPIDPRGPRKPDPVFLGIRVPKAFFKIVVCNSGGRLRAAAFLMSQDHQLQTLKGRAIVGPLETLTTEQARIFFVTVEDVQHLTGLDFGANVKQAQKTTLETMSMFKKDTHAPTSFEIRSLADLRL